MKLGALLYGISIFHIIVCFFSCFLAIIDYVLHSEEDSPQQILFLPPSLLNSPFSPSESTVLFLPTCYPVLNASQG
jgi:hypothetical protein